MSKQRAVPDPCATGAYWATPADGDRFAPGTLLAGRYRVVAPLGKGGMGEVYRADDLTLGQPVALKFLPEHLASDPERLTRFRKEVAAARRVSHPNVCRVYDIAEHEGQSFLTMEFVDGEDLSSLLKRVGRVPEEKGVEIARQLCSALAAVHDQGLLHRDLKPANVMLDGRGKVRLTDFGLAASAEDLSAGEVRSGTPLYQAPEQLSGREVTVRSDVFALGLVLYEIFTGKRAFAGSSREAAPSKPTSHVSNLNPAVERSILRCLEIDPANRPRSALEVLAALPGGDPLAAAVAAGETPSPQLVADGGEVGLIRPWIGGVLLAVVAIELILIAALYDRGVFRRIPTPTHPEALAHQARGVLRDLGADDPSGDTAAGFQVDKLAETYAYRKDPRFARGEPAAPGGPSPLVFFYRRADGPLTPHFIGYAEGLLVSDTTPPLTEPGMAQVTLEPAGRLLGFVVVPGREPAPPAGPIDWPGWIARTGLEPARFEPDPTGPTHPPPVFCTEVLAWRERDPVNGTGCRIEAGALRGRPVYFRVTGPWHGREVWGGGQMPAETSSSVLHAATYTALALLLVLAVRNLLRGRGDLRTATGMMAVLVATAVVARALAGWHAAGSSEFLAPALGWAVWFGLVAGVFYLGLEPTLRRLWPWRMTGWVRLFAGRFRDPLIGRDVLVGMACGFIYTLAYNGTGMIAADLGASAGYEPSLRSIGFGGTAYGPFAPPAVRLLATVSDAMGGALRALSLVLLLFLIVRREGLALAGLALFFLGISTLQNWGDSTAGNLLQLTANAAYTVPGVLLLTRFGLLAVAASAAATAAVVVSPLTLTPSAWYFGVGATTAVVILGLATACAHTATGGRLFKGRETGDD